MSNESAPDEQQEESPTDIREGDELPGPPRGILYERPPKGRVWVVGLFASLCVCASLALWYTDMGQILWVSRHSIFHDAEYWRLLTAIFTHGDIGHLLANLPFVVIFAWLLRAYFGFLAFPLVSLLVGVVTNLATIALYPEHVRLIGASGMLYAMVAMWIAFYYRYEVRYSFGKKLQRIIGVLLVLFFPSAYDQGTSYLSHIFGFVFGLLAAFILIKAGPYDRRNTSLAAKNNIAS